MIKYIVKRLLVVLPTFFGITVMVYLISTMASGDPVSMMFGNDQTYTAEDLELVRQSLGLHQPVYIQYLRWLGQLFRGNLGVSYRTSQPVLEQIITRLGPTLMLTCSATLFSLLIAIPLGVLSAYRPYSGWDYTSSALSFLGSSIPNFFAGLILIYLFSVKLGLLPMGGMYTSAGNKSLPDLLFHLLMPMLVLSIQQIGELLRQTRSSMLEVLHEDYVKAARAQGLGETRVVLQFGLRNALIPIVTQLANMLPFLIGGAVVTEQIFGWPGLGSLMVQSINARDYPSIMGITVFVATAVLVGNVMVDILYAVIDPKIRHGREGGR